VGTSCEEVDVRDVVVGDELGEDFGADETCGAGKDDFHGVCCFFNEILLVMWLVGERNGLFF